MNLNKRQQLLAILAIAMVGLYVADKLVISPLVNAWDARSKRIVKLKEQVRDGEATRKQATTVHRQWDIMRTNSLAWAIAQTKPIAVVKPEAESQMMKAFERWSSDSGVQVSSIRPQWKEGEDDYKTLECRADVAGSLSAVAHFLYQIERDATGVKVDSMEIQSRDNEGSQLALVVQVSGLLLNPPKQTKR